MSTPKKVYLIGDSISIGYRPYLTEALAPDVTVTQHEGNTGDSRKTLSVLDDYLAEAADADVIHFNCGLHDLKLPRDNDGQHQVELEDYRRNLSEVVDKLVASGKKLIWATITPVHDERHESKGFSRRQVDVDAYNAVAREIVDAAGIAVDDLHATIMAAGKDDCICGDGVHMTDDTSRMLGQTVAAFIRKTLA